MIIPQFPTNIQATLPSYTNNLRHNVYKDPVVLLTILNCVS